MHTKNYDVIVIGAGSGGLTSAVGFSKVGKKVLLIEREHMGGECTNTGCIPSKALLHHAKNYHQAFTVSGNNAKSETYRKEAFTYVRNIINSILEEETPETFTKMGIDVVIGEAEFISKQSIKVGETEYQFKKAVIATGSSPRNLDVPGLNAEDVLTNQNLFNLTITPEKLLVIGSGPVGLEMSQALAMLGSNVTIATIDKEFAKFEDKAIRPILKSAFDALHIKVIYQAFLNRIEGKEAVFEIKAGKVVLREERVSFDKILVAIGRTPNLPKGLEVAGIESSIHGITINSQNRTTNKNVFAVGDVAEPLKFTHIADDVGRQVVTHVVSKGLIRVNKDKAVPKVTYTVPEVAQVGLSWTEAVEKYTEEKVMRIEVPFSLNDRAKTDDVTEGVLVVFVKRLSGKVLGANIVGPAAGELISTFTIAIDQKISMWKLQNTIFAYPTYSLIIKKSGDYFFAEQISDLKVDLKNLFKQHVTKFVAAFLWISLIIFASNYQAAQNLTPTETAIRLFEFITLSMWGPLLYILIYAVRPITFFPATALTILSGIFFDFILGTIYTLIAATFASAVAYTVGRFFSPHLRLENTQLGNWLSLLRENTFSAILTMRLIFLPFDLISYAAGILQAKFVPFIIATFLGIILGTATFVSIGASLDVETFRTEGFSFDLFRLEFLSLAALIFTASIGLANFLKKKKI